MTEQRLQREMKKLIESLGGYVIKTMVTNKTGVPDLIVCYKGHFLAFEVKLPYRLSTVTGLQYHHIDAITKAGGKAAVVTSIEEVKAALHSLNV